MAWRTIRWTVCLHAMPRPRKGLTDAGAADGQPACVECVYGGGEEEDAVRREEREGKRGIRYGGFPERSLTWLTPPEPQTWVLQQLHHC